MASAFVVGLRTCCLAVVLALTNVQGAQSHPLLGSTREQVLNRYGEPRSQLTAGSREVLLYPRERLILRDGVVVEVEQLPAEPPKKAPEPAPVAPSSAPATAAPEASTSTTTPSPAPETPSERPAEVTETPTSPPPPPPELKFEIKRVRPPSAGAPVSSQTTPTQPSTKSPAVKSAPAPTSSASAPASRPQPAVTPVPTPPLVTPPTVTSRATEPVRSEITEPDAAATKAQEDVEAEAEKKAAAIAAASRRLEEASVAEPATYELFTTRTYVIAGIVIFGGIGYLIWRHRQRQLELAATAVENTPVAAAPARVAGAVFNAELLAKLDHKRFEDLVAAYYSKTGVVAVSTKSPASGPVHIKISWKGEPRPFALVQCIAQPAGLVAAKALQDLFAVLTTEDIRRGYVVTTGKFNIAARDFAEEKHLTLLPGDILLEKLNALPESARAELMQTIAISA